MIDTTKNKPFLAVMEEIRHNYPNLPEVDTYPQERTTGPFTVWWSGVGQPPMIRVTFTVPTITETLTICLIKDGSIRWTKRGTETPFKTLEAFTTGFRAWARSRDHANPLNPSRLDWLHATFAGLTACISAMHERILRLERTAVAAHTT